MNPELRTTFVPLPCGHLTSQRKVHTESTSALATGDLSGHKWLDRRHLQELFLDVDDIRHRPRDLGRLLQAGCALEPDDITSAAAPPEGQPASRP
jgi:hypothetical protein